MSKILPRYPVYIPSRGRAENNLTAKCLVQDGVPFFLVVAPKEESTYRAQFGDHVILLPSNDMDIVGVRNWIRDRSQAAGDVRHHQYDDNIRHFGRRWRGQRLYCEAGIALRVLEDFTERYTNVALSGLNYFMFAPDGQDIAPLQINCHVYSATLVLNEMPYRWRGPYNDDTDLCLQVLSGGWCTILLNAFLVQKIRTMTMKGGMTDSNVNNYQDDGRLRMAETLRRKWPGVVEVKRRFGRPQHVVNWKKFNTPLIAKPRDQWPSMDYLERIELVQAAPEIKSKAVQGILETWQKEKG